MCDFRIRLKHAGQTREEWVIEKWTFWGWKKWGPSKRYFFRERGNAEHFLEHNRPSYY